MTKNTLPASTIAHYKKLLDQEKTQLEGELKTVGRKSSKNPEKWEATSDSSDVDTADDNLVADSMDTYESNEAILNQLQGRLQEVNGALEKIEKNTYGTCSVCGKEIEKERLDANPAATTCKTHMQ